MNTLYYGDNLKVLREHIKDESVDLIYLDPPFNSNRSYNVLFKDESGNSSDAQITAFDDSWHWGQTAERTYQELIQNAPMNVATLMDALRQFIGRNQMLAYLVMMAARLVELHRVLKPSGSLYLHCDPTASHYLKVLLDMIFGAENFQNEVIWKRSGSHGGASRWGAIHDVLLFYTKSREFRWNKTFESYDEEYISSFYRYSDEKGLFRLVTLTGAGITKAGDSGKAWRGVDPSRVGRHWAVPMKSLQLVAPDIDLSKLSTQEKLDLLDKKGLIYWPPSGNVPQQKRYLHESEGVAIQDVITDILPIGAQAAERLGYPTQKPLELLERIINASSNPGDVVLDPFSGCGTCISAAQKLGRQWIGIDITHLAIAMHKSRLKSAFGLEPKRDYQVIGEPEDLAGARQLAAEDRYQFQWWALSLIEAQPVGGDGGRSGKKGADRGIDGVINFIDDRKGGLYRALVQVKSGHVKSGDIRDLIGALEPEKAQMGIFITLEDASRDMLTTALSAGVYRSELWQRDYPRIQILTVEELLSGAAAKLPPGGTGAFKKAGKIDPAGPTQGQLDL